MSPNGGCPRWYSGVMCLYEEIFAQHPNTLFPTTCGQKKGVPAGTRFSMPSNIYFPRQRKTRLKAKYRLKPGFIVTCTSANKRYVLRLDCEKFLGSPTIVQIGPVRIILPTDKYIPLDTLFSSLTKNRPKVYCPPGRFCRICKSYLEISYMSGLSAVDRSVAIVHRGTANKTRISYAKALSSWRSAC